MSPAPSTPCSSGHPAHTACRPDTQEDSTRQAKPLLPGHGQLGRQDVAGSPLLRGLSALTCSCECRYEEEATAHSLFPVALCLVGCRNQAETTGCRELSEATRHHSASPPVVLKGPRKDKGRVRRAIKIPELVPTAAAVVHELWRHVTRCIMQHTTCSCECRYEEEATAHSLFPVALCLVGCRNQAETTGCRELSEATRHRKSPAPQPAPLHVEVANCHSRAKAASTPSPTA